MCESWPRDLYYWSYRFLKKMTKTRFPKFLYTKWMGVVNDSTIRQWPEGIVQLQICFVSHLALSVLPSQTAIITTAIIYENNVLGVYSYMYMYTYIFVGKNLF